MQRERCARREAWDLAKSVFQLNEKDKATFFSPSEVWSSTAPFSKKPEESEFVSMDMLSRKHLRSAELETFQIFGNLTTILTAIEVQTHEEATVYVHDLELFVKVQILEDMPAVLSLGELCEEHGCSYEWANGQKPQLTKNGKIMCAIRQTSCMLSQDCQQFPQARAQVRPLHRHRRTRLVQQYKEVTIPTLNHPEIKAIQQKPKTTTTVKHRMSEISQIGWREFTENLKDAEMPASAKYFS